MIIYLVLRTGLVVSAKGLSVIGILENIPITNYGANHIAPLKSYLAAALTVVEYLRLGCQDTPRSYRSITADWLP